MIISIIHASTVNLSGYIFYDDGTSECSLSPELGLLVPDGGGGRLPYERLGDACQKCLIKPLKETNMGVAQLFFTLKQDHLKL